MTLDETGSDMEPVRYISTTVADRDSGLEVEFVVLPRNILKDVSVAEFPPSIRLTNLVEQLGYPIWDRRSNTHPEYALRELLSLSMQYIENSGIAPEESSTFHPLRSSRLPFFDADVFSDVVRPFSEYLTYEEIIPISKSPLDLYSIQSLVQGVGDVGTWVLAFSKDLGYASVFVVPGAFIVTKVTTGVGKALSAAANYHTRRILGVPEDFKE